MIIGARGNDIILILDIWSFFEWMIYLIEIALRIFFTDSLITYSFECSRPVALRRFFSLGD